MRILQVISAFPPAYIYGGPTKMAYEISKELVKRSHEVTIYTTDAYDAHSRFDNDENPMWMDGIKVFRFKNVSNMLAHNNFTIAPGMAFALERNIRDFDVIHLHEFRTFQAIFVHYYAKKYEIPYILQPRGSVPIISKSKQKKLFDALFGSAIIMDANKIIASSKIESDQYLDVFPHLKTQKVVNLPNGIDLTTYQNLPNKGEFKKKYLINADEKIILFLSRIHERKGADILMEAFSKFNNEFENVNLVIAGHDEGYLVKLKSIVRKLDIEGKVLFPGHLYERDKLEAYVDADVFVLPSKDRYESFGNVVLEACACGTPVIVTNNCGVSEWIDNDAGFVVGYDKYQLMNAIFTLLNDEELRKRYGEAGKKLVNKVFDWNTIIKRIEEIYETAVKENVYE